MTQTRYDIQLYGPPEVTTFVLSRVNSIYIPGENVKHPRKVSHRYQATGDGSMYRIGACDNSDSNIIANFYAEAFDECSIDAVIVTVPLEYNRASDEKEIGNIPQTITQIREKHGKDMPILLAGVIYQEVDEKKINQEAIKKELENKSKELKLSGSFLANAKLNSGVWEIFKEAVHISALKRPPIVPTARLEQKSSTVPAELKQTVIPAALAFLSAGCLSVGILMLLGTLSAEAVGLGLVMVGTVFFIGFVIETMARCCMKTAYTENPNKLFQGTRATRSSATTEVTEQHLLTI
jgi:hypothetical protein